MDFLAIRYAAGERTARIHSAKLGWGAAMLFRQTGEARWRVIAEAVLSNMVRSQTPEGVWLRPEFRWRVTQPLVVLVDATIERMYYVHEMPGALAAGGAPLPA